MRPSAIMAALAVVLAVLVSPRALAADTPAAGFWTGSTSSNRIDYAWFVGFYSGVALEFRRDAAYRVRPVRDHR